MKWYAYIPIIGFFLALNDYRTIDEYFYMLCYHVFMLFLAGLCYYTI